MANNKVFKNYIAVLAGIIVSWLMVMGVDNSLQIMGVLDDFNNDLSYSLIIILVFYRALFVILGGYVTASLVLSRPIHYAILFGLGLLISYILKLMAIGSEISIYFDSTILLLILPCGWIGGYLGKKRPFIK